MKQERLVLDRNNKVSFVATTSAADTLVEFLEYHKISQKDFGERIGVSQEYISDLLSRKEFLSADLALRVQKATGISAEMLLEMDTRYKLAQGMIERKINNG